MSIVKTGSTIVEAPAPDFDQFVRTGVVRSDALAVADKVDKLKQIKFDPSAQATNVSVTIASQASSSGSFSLPNTAGGVISLDGNGGQLAYSAPVTGATVTAAAGDRTLVIEPLGTLAGLTVVLPATPPDGTIFAFSSTQIITTLTLSAGGSDTIVNAVSTLAANGFAHYVYRASTTKWYRI